MLHKYPGGVVLASQQSDRGSSDSPWEHNDFPLQTTADLRYSKLAVEGWPRPAEKLARFGEAGREDPRKVGKFWRAAGSAGKAKKTMKGPGPEIRDPEKTMEGRNRDPGIAKKP